MNSIEICSKALIQLGCNTISSFDERTVEAEVAKNLYMLKRDALLSSYPWTFSIKQEKLVRIDGSDHPDFRYSFALPNDYLRTLCAKDTGIADYERSNSRIYANNENVEMFYIFRQKEEAYPLYFLNLLVGLLSFSWAMPLTENDSKARFYAQCYDDELKKVKTIDAQQNPPRGINLDLLVKARAGG